MRNMLHFLIDVGQAVNFGYEQSFYSFTFANHHHDVSPVELKMDLLTYYE